MSNTILSVRDLHVKFRLRGRVLHALRGVSLDVYEGESLAIVGESGCGKSVLNKNFIGLLDQNGFIEGGEIRYYGMDAEYMVDDEDAQTAHIFVGKHTLEIGDGFIKMDGIRYTKSE